MTIDEALRNSQEGAFRLERQGFEDWAKGVTLGIEALKRLKRDRAKGDIHPNDSLPGETKK